jgi:hypothetical protein
MPTIEADDIATSPATTTTVTTTLYDLIAAIQTTVEPQDDNLVVATVWHLLRSGQVTWGRTPATCLT